MGNKVCPCCKSVNTVPHRVGTIKQNGWFRCDDCWCMWKEKERKK